MAPKFKFAEGEKVLCFHGPLLYEAKCMKFQTKDKQMKYFIHYSGWNKNWDEWVPESRVLKYNEANLQKQKELEKAHVKVKKNKLGKINGKRETSNESEGASTPSPEKSPKQKVTAPVTPTETPAEVQRKKRLRSEQNVETEDEYVQKVEIKIKVPDELKIWLVDDYDLINQQKKLVSLPARVCVDSIIEEYEKSRFQEKGMTNNKQKAIKEVCKGIREYFNIMLAKQLLYKFERPQHQDKNKILRVVLIGTEARRLLATSIQLFIHFVLQPSINLVAKNPEKLMSQMYGAIHLLRLFAKLGCVLAYTVLDDEAITLLGNHFHDFLKISR